MNPVVSVVIVSDYAGGAEKSWNDIRVMLTALASQDFNEEAEFLLVERADLEDHIPPDLKQIISKLRIVLIAEQSADALKNAGAGVARADIVAILDADCEPDPDWLGHLVRTLREHPEVAVVSGTTRYPNRSFIERATGLIGRSYNYRNRGGMTRFLNPNNVGYRRSVLLEYPLSMPDSPFGANTLQAEALRADGHRLYCEPRMRVTHDYEGWRMERDLRRHAGYALVKTRQIDRRVPFAWTARLGYFSVPLLFAGRTIFIWWFCLKNFRRYGVPWYELPATIFLAPAILAMEIPGMIRALQHRPILETAYR